MPELIPLGDDEKFTPLKSESAAPKIEPLGDDEKVLPVPEPAKPKPKAAKDSVSAVEDSARSVVPGLSKGVGDVLGAPASAGNWLTHSLADMYAHAAQKLGYLTPARAEKLKSDIRQFDNPKDIDYWKRKIGDLEGGYYTPKTGWGKVTEAATEAMPGAALLAPESLGAAAASAMRFGAVPNAVSEMAGQATEGTPLEPTARIVGGLAAAAPGTAKTLAGGPRAMLKEATENVTMTQMADAQRLMQESREIGAPITLPEALQKVTGSATSLADIQRVVEQSRGGGPTMKAFMAERPQQNVAAAEDTLAQISGGMIPPTEVAPRVQKAAADTLDEARQAVNTAAEPYYNFSRDSPIAPADYAPLDANPAYQAALKDVRGHEILGPTVAGLPDNSVGVVDAVKKHLNDMHTKAMKPDEPQRFLGSEIAKGETAARDTATAADPNYEEALRIGKEGRESVVNPMARAPVGQLALSESFPKQAEIIFSKNPLPGSQGQVGAAIRSVAAKDPEAARQFVRMKVEQSFNEAAQNLASGPAQFGAAKFAAVLRGNSQQAKNLQAAVLALPDGSTIWRGMNRMLDVFEAQGARHQPGSLTEFNHALAEDMRKGGTGEIAALAATPGRWLGVATDLYRGMKYGQNTEFFAKLFTSPQAVPELRRLLAHQPDSPVAAAITANLAVGKFAYNRFVDAQQERAQQPSP